ncbi:MAG TPA: hypothetical protein VNN22_03730 [Verrucomicrobiae bacterium]|nr:hypothetical protein [Verrucomicrobiae bacterium]
MNKKMSCSNFFRSLWLAVVVAAVCFPMPALHAQPAERTVHGRFLLIFDTSANMKRRMPAVDKSLNMMLVTSMNGQLHKGDTVGVWTFNQELHPGDYPLQAWNPENAALIASNITHFIHVQKYANTTRYEALQPLLSRVVDGSERLTVIIFSDGATKITGTTFDTGINQLFEQNTAAQKKAREPFVVVLRSQQGKYIGCTVTYPPQLVSFPQFPPLPPLPEPAPIPKPVPAPPPAPAAVVPSMVITGTNVASHQPAPVAIPTPAIPPPVVEPAPSIVTPAATPVIAPTVAPVVTPAVPLVPSPTVPPAATSRAPAVVPVAPTNPVVAMPVNPPAPAPAPVMISPEPSVPPPSLPAVFPAPAPLVPATAQIPVPANNPVTAAGSAAGVDKKPLIIGAICFVAAGLLAVLAFFYFRRPDRNSLISRSMHDR